MPTMRTGRDYRSNNQFNRRIAYSQGVVDRINNNFDSTRGMFRRISWDDAFSGWVPLHPVKDVRQQPSYQNSRMYKNENGSSRRRSRSVQPLVSDKYRKIDKDEIFDKVSNLSNSYCDYVCFQKKYRTQLKQDKGWKI